MSPRPKNPGRLLILGLLVMGLVRTTPLAADAPTSAPTSAPRDLARQALALRAAAQEIRARLQRADGLAENEVVDAAQALAAAMTSDVPAWQSAAAARTGTAPWLEDWHRDAFLNQAGETLRRAQEQSPLPLALSEALQQADADWEQRRTANAQAAANAWRDPIFTTARAQALEALKQRMIEQQTHPPFADLDTRLTSLDLRRAGAMRRLNDEEFATLLPWLNDFTREAGPVFDELAPWVETQSAQRLKGLVDQYQAQTDPLREWMEQDRFPPELRLRDPMRAILDHTLDAAVRPDATAHPPVYPAFAAVRALAADIAAHWEQERFREFLADAEALRVDDDALETSMQASPAAHVTFAAGKAQLTQWLDEQARDRLIRAYAAGAPDTEREAIFTAFSEALRMEGPLLTIYFGRIDALLSARLPEIRRRLAQAQVAQSFDRLNTNRPLPEALIAYAHDQGMTAARSFAEGLEVLGQEPDWLPKAGVPEGFIEEAQALTVDLLNRQLTPACSALTAQLAVIQALEKDWLETLAQDVAAGETADRVLRKWLTEWERRWERDAATFADPWRRMFARTRDQLNKTVRQLYDNQMEARSAASAAAASAAEASPPAEQETSRETVTIESPEASPGVTDRPEPQASGDTGERVQSGLRASTTRFKGVADGVMTYTDLPDGRCRLVFQGAEDTPATEVDFDPTDIDASVERIAAALHTPLRALLDDHAAAARRGGFFFNRSRPEFKLRFLVDSAHIRHRMSIQLRARLQDQIAEWTQETRKATPSLLWQDEVGAP